MDKTGPVGLSSTHKENLCLYLRKLLENRAIVHRIVFLKYVPTNLTSTITTVLIKSHVTFREMIDAKKKRHLIKEEDFFFICVIQKDALDQNTGAVKGSEVYFCLSESSGDCHKKFNSY